MSRLRFSLRLCLLLTAMFCVGFAWMRISRSNRTTEAWYLVDRKTSAGRTDDVVYNVKSPQELELLAQMAPNQVKELRISGAEHLSDQDFSGLSAFRNLNTIHLDYDGPIDSIPFENCQNLTAVHLSLVGQTLSHDHVQRIGQIEHLTSLDLSATNVNDEHVAMILETTRLKELRLGMTSITDASVERISRAATSFEVLDLTGTMITDQSLALLSHLTELEALSLKRLSLSDAALMQLASLRKLKWLRLPKTVSDNTVQVLKKELPECNISNRLSSPPKS